MISMMINLGFSAFMNVLSQMQDELPETASMQETSLPADASPESTPEAGDVGELTPEMQAAISTEMKDALAEAESSSLLPAGIKPTHWKSFLGLLMLIIAFSIVLPQFEFGIPTFWDALWYCFAIVTTIGFGDFSAVTIPGRIISVILGVYGIIVVALITSIIVNFYSETKNTADDKDE